MEENKIKDVINLFRLKKIKLLNKAIKYRILRNLSEHQEQEYYKPTKTIKKRKQKTNENNLSVIKILSIHAFIIRCNSRVKSCRNKERSAKNNTNQNFYK